MDDFNNIGNIEQLLKKNTARKPSALYNTIINVNKTTISSKDVLDSVYSQIRTMQLADGRTSKNVCKNLQVKSSFMPVSQLTKYEVPKQSNTFETQCVSDTQLINIIEDAEALIDTNRGMTQEFSTEFTYTNINNQDNAVPLTQDETDKDNMIETQEFETTFTQTNVDDTVLVLHDKIKRDASSCYSDKDHTQDDEELTTVALNNVDTLREMCNKVVKGHKITENEDVSDIGEANNVKDQIDKEIEVMEAKRADILANNTQMLSNPMEIDEERSLSPVLNIKTKIKTTKSPPLVVSLEAFERFERMAIPLIDSNDDIDTCKHLINSQILGGELCLNTDTDVIFNVGQLSPILEKSCEFFQENTKDLMEKAKDVITNLENIKDSRGKRSDSFNDEILFSSDEENDFIYREFEDIPLTAALETSFFEYSNVLEETMYVGFQTASNKSIQICTDSFKKAQLILDEDENINGKEFSLAELVESCDVKSFNNSSAADIEQKQVNYKPKAEESMLLVKKDNDVIQIKEDNYKDIIVIEDPKTRVSIVRNDDDTIKKPPEKHAFFGFKTASNKTIRLSDKALDQGKKMFMEIDFDENDLVHMGNSSAYRKKTEVVAKDTKTDNASKYDVDNNINDDLIIQEFENIQMSIEDKEKSCDENTVPFPGFKTASNRKIDVSDAAKTKIKDIFQDINLGEMNEEVNPANNSNAEIIHQQLFNRIEKHDLEVTTFVGFKTANNKNINISAQALAKTKNIFQDDKDIVLKDNDKIDDLKVGIYKNHAVDYLNQPSTSKTDFVGFKTANNKNIKISEVALSKSSKIFKDIEKENTKESEDREEMHKHILKHCKSARSKKIFENLEKNERNAEELPHERNDGSFDDLKTANNKTVVVYKDSIAKSKKIFEDLDAAASKRLNNQPNDDTLKTQNCVFKGFETASRKPVNVSTQATERSKKIFKDIDDNVNIGPETKFKGFQTASSKKVAVTKEALDASKKLIEEVNIKLHSFLRTASDKNVDEAAVAKCRKIFDDIPTEDTQQAFGFQTANNKKVEVSKDAIEKTKDMFKDFEIPEITPTFKGFQTASKKKVEISKEAIEKTKAMFNDFDLETKGSTFSGFITAGNKKVQVSKDAIDKTKNLFDDAEVSEINTFKGFQTASKKTVHVSALAKCKDFFKDIDKDDKNINKSDKNEENANQKSVFSFQTANNQCINVSEDALRKSKMLFEGANNTKTHLDDATIYNVNKNVKSRDTEENVETLNTQVLNNFETSLCTEDFKETPRKSKRSGSPILSCPRAKKRKKFETPYKDIVKTEVTDVIKTVEIKAITKTKFTENYKKNKTYKLKDLTIYKKNIDPYITNFNLDNIDQFVFDAQRNDITDTKMSIEELKIIFLNGVNKNLVPEGWMDIQIKLILWKLLSYESKYNYFCKVQDVIDQLKYRYDVELYNAERSALRKIFEKDDVASKTMVLCVAGIFVDGVSVSSVASTNDVELLLTDGWYFIKATTDRMLSKLVCNGKIVIGCKIVTSGAELVNCEGMAPWEDTSSVRLKIFGNSTRRARWDSKLGYTSAAILSQLSSVKVDGGKINRLKVYVTRVYPLLYVEKFEDGSTVTRSERLEHLHQIKYETDRELMMERIYEEVQREFSDQESQDSELLDSGKRKYYDSGSQIAKMMKISKDPMEFRAQLTSTQEHLLQDHTYKHREKVLQAIQSRVQEKITVRNVVTLARGRIASVNGDGSVTKGMLSVWKPNDAVLDIFREGSLIEIMNTVPTAVRYSEIQITAGRQSMFRAIKSKTEISRHLLSLKRTCYKISDVVQNPTMTTAYNEIDTVGIVFLIEPSHQEFESNKNFQNIYLADSDKNIISVNFWGGIKKFGFENILDTGQIVACANVQKRAGNSRKNIPQFRVTEFSHFTKTPRNALAKEIVDELNKKSFGLDRRKFCDDCVAIKNNYAAIRCLNDSENESPYRFCKSDYSYTRNKMFIETPLGIKTNKNEDANLNLTGLDFESTFKQDSQELSPKTLLRKKKVNEKIAKLKMYGEPPPLNHISIIDKSVNAKSSYKSPIALNTPTLARNVAIVKKLPGESSKTRDSREKSPVFPMKRTYVSVPVKLNFANESKNDLEDHFAGEFDGSPPLSLD